MSVTKIQPKMLFQRALEGRVLYTHVVVAETQSLIFISGQLARDQTGNIVGPRNMRAQINRLVKTCAWPSKPQALPWRTWSRRQPSSPISTSSFVMSMFGTTISGSGCRRALLLKCVASPILT